MVTIVQELEFDHVLMLKGTYFITIEELVDAITSDRKVLTLDCISQFQEIGTASKL